ncbi:MAG: bifunctional diaminohydroxyphosphoribosylaminopyrimidine deaminase/5-amino-6-(5-phosphoribosylamino)uracil reductase RibD [Brevinematia bacterium]
MESKKFFLMALRLAESVKGLTSPNPAVGCVIEKGGKVVGRGATQRVCGDHAEICALKEAKGFARGSTVYLTLEPCVDYEGKRTPSCTEALIKAGVKKVVLGTKDPNPYVNGRGIERLKEAGIEVEFYNEYERKLIELNEDFFKYIKTGLPFVSIKAAMTLDGNIATYTGDSKWISCEESRRFVHILRNKTDAILVGVSTVLRDNPELSVRHVEKLKDPLRIVIDPYGKANEDYNVMSDKLPTLFITTRNISTSFIKLCEKHKKEILMLDLEDDGLFSFRKIFSILGKRGITSILVEGGAGVFYNLFRESVVDKLYLFISPKLLCGRGIPLLDGLGVKKISEAIKINNFSVENIGEDILFKGYISQYGDDIK